MAVYTAEGKLWIELVDLYVWLNSRGVSTEETKVPVFSIDEDALKLEYTSAKEPVLIASEDLWAWIIDKQLPAGLSSGEVLFGVPRVDGPDLVVAYAASSDTHPSDWAKPPYFLNEWQIRRGGVKAVEVNGGKHGSA